jgi:hypothetical protein
MTLRTSPNDALRFAFAPLGAPTFCGDVSVTTSSALLVADASDVSGNGCRRIRICNTDASAVLGIFDIAAGATATGLVIANSCKILPGQSVEWLLRNDRRLSAVGSASLTANVFVQDIG